MKFTLALFLLIPFAICAQRPIISNIDSLLQVLNNSKEDSSKVKLYGDVAFYYSTKDLDKAIQFAEQGLFLAKQIKDNRGEAASLLQIGMLNNDLGKISSAINNFELALELTDPEKDKKFHAKVYNNLGMSYFNLSKYDVALDNYFKAIKLLEGLDDLRLISTLYNNIANVFIKQKKYEHALTYHFKCLKIAEDLKNETLIAGSYNNLGIIYREIGQPEKALEYYFKTLEIAKRINHKLGLSFTFNNIGTTYLGMKKDEKALDFFFKALEIKKEIGEQKGIANTLNNIGTVYLNLKNVPEALKCFEQSLSIGNEIGEKLILEHAYAGLSQSFALNNDYRQAYEYQKLYTGIKDSIYNEESTNKMAEMSAKYENDKKEKELKLQTVELEKRQVKMDQQKIQSQALMAGLILVIALGTAGFFAFRQNQKANKILQTKNEKILQQNKVIEKAHAILENKSKDITESILYARKIQEAILPAEEDFKNLFPQSFIFFRPKDFVSGDFYWFSELGELSVVVVADCTGHGVPGAFMSMIGNDLLNQVVNDGNLSNPAGALGLMDKKISRALTKSKTHADTKDGIDMAMIAVDKNKNELLFAGANRPLWIIRTAEANSGDKAGPALIEYKPINLTLGIDSPKREPFITHRISLEKGDAVYLFTDGFADQFGGEKNKKFLTKRLKELLLANSPFPMDQQKSIIEKALDDWRGKQKQVDDICVVGLRV